MNGDSAGKIEVNIYNGGMASFADGNSVINAVQNNNSKVSANGTRNCGKFQNNKKQDYIDNWNSRLFLHMDNDERPLTLADAFIVPDYNYHLNDGKIKFSDQDTLDEVIEKFIDYHRSSNMLITGAPGTGKTSIVSWIAHEYKENADIIILRFRDWEKDELNNGLLKCICNTLHCINRDLENKILILDGFDEIKSLDNCNDLLNDLFNDILDFKNIKIIITSRTYYIRSYLFQSVFELLPFEIDKIEEFYFTITDSNLSGNLDINNLDVLGIPVILYMAIMSDIDVTKEATKPELYSKIFAEKGGIFDKFTYSGDGYDYGNQPLRDIKNIKKYLGFLQEIAFEMFDEEKLSLPRKEDKIPKLKFQGAEISVLEFPIKHLFDNTLSNIEFVHKSIYEYFVSEYIFSHINSKIDLSLEEIATFFGNTFNKNILTKEILEFLRYKVEDSHINKKYNIFKEVFNLMIKSGMTYFTQKCYKNAIKREINVFMNMLEVIHLWEKEEYILDSEIKSFLKYKTKVGLNLKRVKLNEGIDLTGICLKNSDLHFSNLKGANLQNADLRQADLRNADLRGADLRNADLRGADLSAADLRGAHIEGINIYFINFDNVTLDENQFKYLQNKYCFKGIKINVVGISDCYELK